MCVLSQPFFLVVRYYLLDMLRVSLVGERMDFRSSFPNDASCIGSVTSILGTWGRAPACCPIARLVLQYWPTWHVKLFHKVGQHCLASIPGRPGPSYFWAVRFYLIDQNWPVLDTSIFMLLRIGMISPKKCPFLYHTFFLLPNESFVDHPPLAAIKTESHDAP